MHSVGGEKLHVPFPYFGGKSRAAGMVWERFGAVQHYIEPFAGSLAVLLARPPGGNVLETVNDLDGFVSNFWRSVVHDPDGVAHHADWLVNERDLSARHYWLVTEGAAILDRLAGDPDGYDSRIAGWWLWGICAWIGSGWCSGVGPWQWANGGWAQLPRLADRGMGINRPLPSLTSRGRGINRQLPSLTDRTGYIFDIIHGLHDRLRDVRVCNGGWERVVTDCVTDTFTDTAVFLDPPYAAAAGRTPGVYAQDSLTVADDVREWALSRGENLKIALCGYAGEHEMPDSWREYAWKANGGYANAGSLRRENRHRERIWFSPFCGIR